MLDFVIAVLALVELLLENSTSLTSASILRSFQALRVLKLAKSWLFLYTILKIFAYVMDSLSYLIGLLLIIVFTFALMGKELFGEAYASNACKNPSWNCEVPRSHFIDFYHRYLLSIQNLYIYDHFYSVYIYLYLST